MFLFYGWYSDNWWVGTEKEQECLRVMYPGCTAEQRASVAVYSLAPLQAEFLVDQDESAVIDSGIVSYYVNRCIWFEHVLDTNTKDGATVTVALQVKCEALNRF